MDLQQFNIYYNENFWHFLKLSIKEYNCIGCVMVSMIALSALDHGFEPQSGQTRLWNW